MNSSTPTSLLFTLSLIFISHAPLPAYGTNLYETVCKEAGEDTARCLQVLKADPRIVLAKNYLDLCKFILDMAINKTTEAQNYIIGVMATNPSLAIRKCATTIYGGAIAEFRFAMNDLIRYPEFAKYDAKLAGDEPAYCQRALAIGKIYNPSIDALNNETLLFSKIADLATNHLLTK